MAEPQIHYDEPSDTLHVSFAPGEGATGVELNESLLLRIDKPARRPAGLTVFNCSLLAQATEIGPRSVPLTGLAGLRAVTRAPALTILQSAPVNEFLLVSAYSPASREVIRIALLRLDRITSRAVETATTKGVREGAFPRTRDAGGDRGTASAGTLGGAGALLWQTVHRIG